MNLFTKQEVEQWEPKSFSLFVSSQNDRCFCGHPSCNGLRPMDYFVPPTHWAVK
jgi:hypothetical protein